MTDLSERTLGSLLEEPSIRAIAPFAIKCMDLPAQPMYGKTLARLRQEGFGGGNLERGFRRLLRAAQTEDWFLPLYEGAAEPEKRDCSLLWFPSEDPKADERPFILLIPGGGFVNVWNLNEGWPMADHFNAGGYHAFVLTYRVGEKEGTLDKEMDDVARALRLIAANACRFHVRPDRYVTCGFSAGGYITCLWSTRGKGWAAHGLPRPMAMLPVYPVVSFRQLQKDRDGDPDLAKGLFYTDLAHAVNEDYEIPEHVEGFPPCHLFLAAEDTLVPPVHSRLLKAALDEAGIPCCMEMGPTGGHGFADGEGSCMEGWPERAMAWLQTL